MKSPFSPALRARSVADIVRKGERTALLGAIVLLCCACTHAYQWKSLGPFETSGAE